MRERVIKVLEELQPEWEHLLSQWIQIPSVVGSGVERQMQLKVARAFRELGVDVEVWEPSLLPELPWHPDYVLPARAVLPEIPVVTGYRRGRGRGRSLVLNGHVDVVPVDDQPWTYDPWNPIRDGDRLYGRGSLDMKAGLVAMWAVCAALRELNLSLQGDLIIQSVADEEETGNHTLACCLKGIRGDGTAYLEPAAADMGLVRGAAPVLLVSSRGAQFFRVTVEAPADGGVEYQRELVNPIGPLMHLYHAVERYSDMREAQVTDPLYADHATKLPAAVCRVYAGNWPSTIPRTAVMEGTIECLPGERIDEVMDQFERYLNTAAAAHPWLKDHPPRIERFGLRYESAATPVDDVFVRTAAQSLQRVYHQSPWVTGGGGNDLRHTVRHAKSPSVIFGPDGGHIHGTDEWVSLSSLAKTVAALFDLVVSWCGVDGGDKGWATNG
ncbi:MAG: M20/M25/M40 family metallo-hydrolase [Firmicutes bacterium]|nr:M20/M25/M40 family metallo-hydrolase [Bacillota bacterium]